MEKAIQESSDKKHILLTSLGVNAFPTTYEWGKERATADFAPLALMEFLEKLKRPMPNHVVAVVTQGAKRETWQRFRAGVCKTLKFSPELVEIPDGSNTNEIRQILESVANRVPEGAELTLDVTHGLRHFPFIFYALALYLKSLRGVEIRGAYYGMVDAGPSKPIIDLQPLLELPEWFHAVRMFREQGTTKPMADLLQPLENQLRQEGTELRNGAKKPPPKALERYKEANQVKNSVEWLKNYAFAYESALPLELEKASRGLVDSIKELSAIDSPNLPLLVEELTKSIASAAQKTAFVKPPADAGLWKKDIPLNEDELKRQAYMIDLYLERGQLALAVGLMREWVVSWAIWRSGETKKIEEWLNKHVREEYERKLGAVVVAARGGPHPPTGTPIWGIKRFGNFWNQLTNTLRNAILHNAMRVEAVEKPPSTLKGVQEFWNCLK